MLLRVSGFPAILITLLIISSIPLCAEIGGPIPVPEFHKQSLLNGMEVLFLPGGTDRVYFVLMVKNGAAFDPIQKWGVTYLTSRMIFEGDESRTGLPIQRDLTRLGAELDFRVEPDAIFYYGNAPADRAIETLGLLGEMVVRPQFQEETFERLRSDLVEELEEENEWPQSLSQELFLAELFRSNPYAHSVKGTLETVRNLHITDVRIQYRKLFMPNQAQLAFYHPGDRDRAFSALSRRWGSWTKHNPLPFTFRKALPPEGRRVLLVDSSSQDGLLRWGTLSVEKDSADYYPLKVFEQYLTLTLPSWATQVTSETQIKASFEFKSGMMPGYLQLNIQAPFENLIPYYRRLEDFVKEVQSGQVDDQKLEESKRLAYLDLKQALDRPLPRLRLLLEIHLYNLGVNFITHYGTRLNRVTAPRLADAVQKYLSLENFLLSVAGPTDQLKTRLDEIGQVEIRP